MAPKRRRPNTAADAGENRPSPHRPERANLAQHDRSEAQQGGRRSSRGGHGARGGRRSVDVRENPNNMTVSARATPTPGPISSPAPRPTSATHTPTPSGEAPSPIVRADLPPFDYTFLTDEQVSSWATNGRKDVIAGGIQSRQDEDKEDLATLFQELIRASLEGRIDAMDAGKCVKEIIGPDTASTDDPKALDLPSFFLDILSMVCELEVYSPVLRTFLFATGISQIILLHKLDSALLMSLGLVRDIFNRVGTRQTTNLIYRQSNYNLLREETEGYSKLMTDLYTASGSEPPTADVVEEAFEKVKGHIGAFDLDVGRVLDITLDVFAAVLIKNYRFFIKLLRVSSWWPQDTNVASSSRIGGVPKWALPTSPGYMPTEEDEEQSKHERSVRDNAFWPRAREVGLKAFFELGGRQVADAESKKSLLNRREDETDVDADRQWIEETETLPPSGNAVAAQLLGFKLRFYTSPARDNDDLLPANLSYLTALLIKIGFISLRDLYPHLWPLDEDMKAVRAKRMKELEEKEKLDSSSARATNALMTAGALADDTIPSGSRLRETAPKIDTAAKAPADVEDKDKLDEPIDQKVQLLINLLLIGAIPESLFILGRFPWLPETYPEILDHIHRILNWSIKDVYDATRPPSSQVPECLLRPAPDSDQNGVPKGHVRLAPVAPRKLLRWPYPDKYDTNENQSYRFYWDEWADNVPVCQTVDDVFTLCDTLLNISGVNIGRDASLLSKLARIGAKSLSEDHSEHNYGRWQKLLKRVLVPALSMTKSNISVGNEIFHMLRFYPVSVRYSIYAEWFEGQTSQIPSMVLAFNRTKDETERMMKRISESNTEQMSRSLAKASYASPGIVFRIALAQTEVYDNFSTTLVSCSQYFSDLGYDVLVWSLMSSLGGNRNRNNAENALLPSKWLLALSAFSGKVFKRYSNLNLSPILRYVSDQLYQGNSTDLVILKELIAHMAGIIPDTDYTDAQISGMTGGPALRRQTLISLQDTRYESVKSGNRLMKIMADSKLAGQMLILIAQHRQAAIYNFSDGESNIKWLATMVDNVQSTLFYYLDFLRSHLAVADFDELFPTIPELMADFGLESSFAFMIGRTSLAERISNLMSPLTNGAGSVVLDVPTPANDSQGDISMIEAGDQSNGLISREGASSMEALPTPSITNADASSSYHHVLAPIIAAVGTIKPEGSWNAITSEFYVTFWALAMSDLSVPSRSYDIAMSRVVDEGKALLKDRSDMSRAGVARRDEAKKGFDARREELGVEFTKRAAEYTQRKQQLLDRKSFWIESSVKADAVSDAILEKCILPRVVLSPSDADYCFKMIKFLHDNATPNFRTLSLLNQLFKANRLRALIFTCTVREAQNLGRFFKLVLNDLARWHKDTALYEKEAWGLTKQLPGFAKAVGADGIPKGLLDHDDGAKGFKCILYTWHKNLNTALRDCLESSEWMHIRNAITILKGVVEVFPAVDFMGNNFIKQLETIASREKVLREDLSLTGNATLVELKKKSTSWVMVQAFSTHITGAPQSNGTSVRTPANGTAARSALQPTAAEFRPGSRASSIGVSTSHAPNTAEVEDGEVDDAQALARTLNESATHPGTPTVAAVRSMASTPAGASRETPKSEILLRREQILREREEAKSTTASSSTAGRPESFSNVPSSSLLQKSTNLPNRPDAPIPPHRAIERHRQPSRVSDRQGDHRITRDSRDTPYSDPNRLDRPGDRLNDFPRKDRRDQVGKDFGRPETDLIPPRDVPSREHRARPEPPPRWTPDSQRENADRLAKQARGDPPGNLSRDANMPPPRSSISSADRGTFVNQDKLTLVNSERQELINPERAALITGSTDSSRSDSPRRSRDDRDRTSSRPQSPRRHALDRDFPDSRRDDRSVRNSQADGHTPRRGEETQPPAGPRSERTADRASERSLERPRDASTFQSSQPSSRITNPDHGRLISSPRQPSDPNFGRLNSAAVSDIPSGPRDRQSHGGRMPGSAQNRPDGRQPAEGPRPPTPEKQVPTGPSMNRQPRRTASGQFDQPSSGSSSVPTTPLAASSATGIHPDRLKHLGPGSAQSPQPSPVPTRPPPTGIHPDRMKAFNDTTITPSASPASDNRPRPAMPSVVTAGPPSGPKGSQPSPTLASNGFSAPKGPASAVERAQRGGRRQLGAINNMLQQAGQQNGPHGMSVRGRGTSRINSGMQSDNPNSAPTTPVVPPPPPPPPGRPESSIDLMNPERADLITGGGPPTDERDRDRLGGKREKSGHHSRRGSQSPHGSVYPRESRRGAHEDERGIKRGAPDDERSQDSKRRALEDERAVKGEHRDRRGGERDSERERHGGRETARDQGRDGMAPRDGGRDRDRRDGRERDGNRDSYGAGWPGANERAGEERGSGARRNDNRSDTRTEDRHNSRGSRDDSSRKRKSEGDNFDRERGERKPRRRDV